MLLTVKERLTLLQSLPREGNFLTLKVLRKLKDSLGMDESELKEYDFKQDGSTLMWNRSVSQEKEIDIGEKASDIIKEALLALDKQKKLTEDHFGLYERFVGE